MAGELVQVLNNKQLDEKNEKGKEENFLNEIPDPPIQALAAHIRSRWEQAKRAKKPAEARMLESKRQRNGEYGADHLLAMKAMNGADYKPVWMHITETKSRAAESWVKDIIFQPGVDPFDVQPTPVPEMPVEMEEDLKAGVFNQLIQEAMVNFSMLGIQPDSQQMMSDFEALMPTMEVLLEKKIKEEAKKAAGKMKEKINDQFHEGGWYTAVDSAMYDIVTYGTCIIRGPYDSKDLVRSRKLNPVTGKFDPSIEARIIPRFGRVNPLNFYPGPDNLKEDDGYTCELMYLTRKELSDLRDVDGFDREAINRVLEKHKAGGLHEWTDITAEKAALDEKADVIYDMEKIACISFWGTAPRTTLKEWGFKNIGADDDHAEDSIGGWLIGSEVIKAILNPDPLGGVPYSKSCFSEDPDNFWGKGVPELIRHVQQIANSAARSLVNNVAIASGPQVELNIDRKAPGTTATLYPWKIWETTNQGIQDGKAVNFYQPPMVVDKLLSVYEFCSKIADEDSGVPRYAHGDPASTGAGDTASGLSMLMTQAARGIKNVIKNIDKGIIKKCVEKLYYHNSDYYADEMPEIIGDVKVVPKGSSSLIAKEQQAIRRKDFLVNTNNPIDMEIIGLQGRRELLKESIKALEMDSDKILADSDELEARVQARRMAPPPSDEKLNAAGEPVAGTDFDLNEAQAGATS